MENNTQKYIVGGVVAVLCAAVIWFALSESPESKAKQAAAASFGACLKQADVKFYGASWCPHCQRQKKLLTTSGYAPIYIECATPDGQGQKQVCRDAKVSSYPTWSFKDGSRVSGEQTLATVGKKAGCEVPVEYGEAAKAAAVDIPAGSPVDESTSTLPAKQ